MSPTEKNNQRKEARFSENLELLLSDGKIFVNSIIYDISIGGIGIESSKMLEEGEEIQLVIDSDPPVKVKGIVRWCHKSGLRYHLGVEFSNLNPGEQWEIHRIVSAKKYWELNKQL